MYDFIIKPGADKIFKKLSRKNPVQLKIIWKKIEEIRQNPFHNYKFLRKPLQMFNGAHIDKHFVLLFSIVHKKKIIYIHHYGHHDEVYVRFRT